MPSSLSNLVDNVSEGLHNYKWADCKPCLDYISTNDDQLMFKCSKCNRNYKKELNKNLIKRFGNTYQFRNEDINKSILLLRKGIYPYDYMNSWKRFDETSLPDKEAFYSRLNTEGVTSVDYRHAKRVFKNFNNKDIDDYPDL